jgi:hypothetical protein
MPMRPPSSVDMAILKPVWEWGRGGRHAGGGDGREVVTEACAAQQRVGRQAHVFEHEVARAAAPDAHLVLLLAQGQALRGFGNDEGGDTLVFGGFVGGCKHDGSIGFVPIGDPALRSTHESRMKPATNKHKQTRARTHTRTQTFVPFSIQPPLPSLTAVVDAAPASLPLPGSVKAKQPSLLPLAKGFSHCCFCCSLPYDMMGAA